MTRNTLLQKLESLKARHRELDEHIHSLKHSPLTQFKAQQLKRDKLALRDHIQRLESELYPDIIA